MAKQGVSAVIVTYHGERFVGALLRSLTHQTHAVDEIVIIDNSSDHGTVDAIHETGIEVTVDHQGRNLDFSAGYNAGMQRTQYDKVLILNQDVELEGDAVAQLVAQLDADPRMGALAPRLLRDASHLDARGIVVEWPRRYRNLDEGVAEQDASSIQPFGVSGAVVLFRRAALLDIAAHGGGGPQEFFDEEFVAYKEDVDLSYRMHHRGWGVGVCDAARALHIRTARDDADEHGLLASRRGKSFRIRGNSYRNQFWVLVKNEPIGALWSALPFLLLYEGVKTLFILLTEPSTLRILPSLLRGLPRMWRKRKAILGSSVLRPRSLHMKLFRRIP